MEFLIIGVVTAVNIIIILLKLKLNRYEDALFDAGLLTLVVAMFSGSYGGMVVSTITSMVISIYLYANPPTFFRQFFDSVDVKELAQEAKTFVKTDLSTTKKKTHVDITELDI